MNPESGRTQTEEAGDDALVAAAQRGDHAAFTGIVQRYQRAVYRIAYGLTRNASDSDDLAQETFLRAYQAIGRFRVGEPLYPWLSRIAVNLAYSLFRRRRRRPEDSIEPLVEAGREWAGPDDPAREAGERDAVEHMQRAFAELSDDHQAVLVLRVVEGLSYDEISQALEVPVGTVMSRLSRARAELRAKVEARTGESATEEAGGTT
jgi:RNA polymerase sigma-70 factor (ECF subfamily)